MHRFARSQTPEEEATIVAQAMPVLPIVAEALHAVGYKRKAENLMEGMVYDMIEDTRCETPVFGRTPAINCGPTAAAKRLRLFTCVVVL